MSELKLPAASGGGSISIKGPASSGSDVDLLDTSGNLTINGQATIQNKDDDNVNVLEVKNDNGNVSGGFSQASDGDGQIFSKKNDGTNTVLFRSDGDSYLLGGDLGIGESAPEELLHITHASAPAIQLEATSGGPYKSLIKMGGNDMEIRGSSGQIQFFQGNADGDSSSEKLRISSHGGIAFNGDTAAANCLNDYEEGTYNPSWGGVTNTNNYNEWIYRKVGNLVYITGRFKCATTTNNGTTVHGTVPFTPASNPTNGYNTSVGTVMHHNVDTYTGNFTSYLSTTTNLYFYKCQDNGGWDSLGSDEVAVDDEMIVSLTYITG